jgi:hypothetical protein
MHVITHLCSMCHWLRRRMCGTAPTSRSYSRLHKAAGHPHAASKAPLMSAVSGGSAVVAIMLWLG